MKKTALVTGILFAFGAAGTAGTAMANAHEETLDDWTENNNVRLFRVMDEDGDGFLSRDEASNYDEVDNLFDHLDRDGDDELSNEEFGEYNPSVNVIEQVRDQEGMGMNDQGDSDEGMSDFENDNMEMDDDHDNDDITDQ